MSCYHPLKGFIIGINENGKKDLKIVPYDTECLYQPYINAPFERHGHILDENIFKGRIVKNYVTIPCGQCVGCRLDYSRQWAIRCMLESEYHESNYFLTITYDDEHVPRSEYVDEDGVVQTSLTLVKKDLQKFCKDLRNRGYKFRFYACGEYGSTTARPHYHMIIFGLKLDDLQLYKKTEAGVLYNSPTLDDIWKKGYIVIGAVTFESCAYVSRYIMKKLKGESAQVYEDYNILPEFVNMSRKPGIANQYFLDNYKDIYDYDSIIIRGGQDVRPPRYFDNIMDTIDEELMEDIKLKRKDIAEHLQHLKQLNTSADYQMQLRHEENNKESQIKKLVRPISAYGNKFDSL